MRISRNSSFVSFVNKSSPLKEKLSENNVRSCRTAQTQHMKRYSDPATLTKPASLLEVAVPKPKLKEVQSWLENWKRRGGNPYLVLQGPPGCGKSTLVKLLCADMKIDVLEYEPSEEYSLGHEYLKKECDEDTFTSFLRQLKYRDVTSSQKGLRVIMIDEIPQAFVEKPQLLHSIIATRTFNTLRHPTCAVIFIISTYPDMSWTLNPLRIFTPDVLARSGIPMIEFNRATETNVVKALTQALKKVGSKTKREDLDAIVTQSNGDIRHAIYQALFCFPVGFHRFGSDELGLDKHDQFICDFRLIGRILHAKYEVLISNGRPEPVYSAWSLAVEHPRPINIINFVYNNYLPFPSSLRNVYQIAKTLSFVDRCWNAFRFEDRDRTPEFEICLKQVLIGNVTEANYQHINHKLTKLKKFDFHSEKEVALLNYRNGRFLFPLLLQCQQHMTEVVYLLKQELSKNPRNFNTTETIYIDKYPKPIDLSEKIEKGRFLEEDDFSDDICIYDIEEISDDDIA